MSTPQERDPDCLFCRIVAGEVPADVVQETSGTLAFRDLEPQAPSHVLVVPKTHQPDAAALAAHTPAVLLEVMGTISRVVELEGLADGYRIVFNTGPRAQQSVPHAHAHVLGGRDMTWPPG